MSAKRRDNRNRILRNGESQRKDGRYMYKYIDNVGNAKYVYSWKLVKTDTVPQGAKKAGIWYSMNVPATISPYSIF